MKITLLFMAQTTFLWSIYWIGNQISSMFNLPIPGNVIGLVLLFGLLCSGVVRSEHIELASNYLLKHLSFFFIPIAVGLMNWGGLFSQYALVLSLTVVISAVMTLLIVAFIVQMSQRGSE